MKKKLRIVLLVAIVLCMLFVMTACEYGETDKLGIADKSFGERIWIGIQVSLLGIGTVFVVLFALILFVSLIKLISLIGNKKQQKQQALPQAEKAPALPSGGVCEDDEVVAAITAALQVYYEAQNAQYPTSNLRFKVRSIKQIK